MNDIGPTAVSYRIHDGTIAVLTIDWPPVNALSPAVRDGMLAGFRRAVADTAVSAIVIRGAKGKFIAGADIRSFGGAHSGATLPVIQAVMESSSKPIIAAIEGYALGGGLEIALAAHFRIAAEGTRFGLPEVNLGLLPGAGGTQRLPRLIGIPEALDLMLSGRHVSSDEALALGIIDSVCPGDPLDAALDFARHQVAQGGPYPCLMAREDRLGAADPSFFAQLRAEHAKAWRGMIAPGKIVDCVEAATLSSGEAALEFEQVAFRECLAAPSRAAQIHLFFGERAAATASGKPRSINAVGILGAGNAELRIARLLAKNGVAVRLHDPGGVVRQGAAPPAGITTGAELSAFGEVDMAIMIADGNVQADVPRVERLGGILRQDAILAIEGAGKGIDTLARHMVRPERVIGFNCVEGAGGVRLIEHIRASATSDQAAADIIGLTRRLRSIPLSANRTSIDEAIAQACALEVYCLLLEGATPVQIDNAMEAFGFTSRIFRHRDMHGLEIADQDAPFPNLKPCMHGDQATAMADQVGPLDQSGKMAGAGLYRQGQPAGDRPPARGLAAFTPGISETRHVQNQTVTEEVITSRIIHALVNEAAWLLHRGVARRSSDIDVLLVHGYGFPKFAGGPMFWAERQGIAEVLSTIRAYHGELGNRWAPAPALEQAVANGGKWVS